VLSCFRPSLHRGSIATIASWRRRYGAWICAENASCLENGARKFQTRAPDEQGQYSHGIRKLVQIRCRKVVSAFVHRFDFCRVWIAMLNFEEHNQAAGFYLDSANWNLYCYDSYIVGGDVQCTARQQRKAAIFCRSRLPCCDWVTVELQLLFSGQLLSETLTVNSSCPGCCLGW
jgi:hypothetical protein